ncbi:hypothetical protein [Anaeromusa acidaminophila]|uniref:hypothetical protein n=1 Tax=Anaeromusa acidaminophila TaxID=81464 RepID=UPI00036539B8|nr:hypothetical protein [Anaeromusa acidaminophila]
MSNKEKIQQRQALIKAVRANREHDEATSEYIWERMGTLSEPQELIEEQQSLFDKLKELLSDRPEAIELLCHYDFTMTEKASAMMEQAYRQGFKDGLNSKTARTA